MRAVLSLIVVAAHILTTVRGRAKWYLSETENKVGHDYGRGGDKVHGCSNVDKSGKFLKVGEKWTNKECATYTCVGQDAFTILVPPVWRCGDGEKSVEPQYPECLRKCVPESNDYKESKKSDDKEHGCSNVGGSGKFLKVGEKWTDKKCTTYKCEGQDKLSGLIPPVEPCLVGEKINELQYPECKHYCVPDKEDSDGNNEDDGVQCSEGKNKDGTCSSYSIPPDDSY